MSFTEEFLSLLSKTARAAIPAFRAVVAANPGATSQFLIDKLAEAGISIRRQDALSILRTLQDAVQRQDPFRSTPNDVVPSLDTFGRALTPTSQNFSYLVQIRGRHPETGEKIVRHVTVTSNDILSKTQVLGVADSFAGIEGGSKPLEDSESEVVSALVSADFEE